MFLKLLLFLSPGIFFLSFVNATINCTTEVDECDINPNMGLKNDVSVSLINSIGQKDIRRDFLTLTAIKSIFNSFDRHCSLNVQQHSLAEKYDIKVDMLKLHYMTPCENFTVSLSNADDLWQNIKFDIKKKVVILATGWNVTYSESVTVRTLAEGFFCHNDVNFIVIENLYYADTPYIRAALNSGQVGELVAMFLQSLYKMVPVDRIHLIGHSLGAHIMGNAGRIFYRHIGKKIARITALDPAKPCFSRTVHRMTINANDADLVDVIHSNSGLIGKLLPVGSIDFYPGGIEPIVPDCKSIFCSHQRAVGYFAESLYDGNEHKYVGHKCNTWKDLLKKTCTDSETTPMGYAVDHDKEGIFFVPIQKLEEKMETEADGERKKNEQNCNVCAK